MYNLNRWNCTNYSILTFIFGIKFLCFIILWMLTSLNLSIFIVSNVNCVMSSLNINRVTIYTAKCLGKVTLKVLLTICYRCNSEESTKFPNLKIKLNKISADFPVQIL